MKKATSLSKIRLDQQEKRKLIMHNILQAKSKNQHNQNTQVKFSLGTSNSLSSFRSNQFYKSSLKAQYEVQKQKQVRRNFDNVEQLLLKAKSITQVQQNKLKIDKAKKFKINHKKNAITFLTGLQIIQLKPKDKKLSIVQKETPMIQTDQELRKLLNPEYDDLEQLRRMIKQTGKNLKSYRKQTLSIKKQVLNAGQKFNKNGYSLADMNYKRINNFQFETNQQPQQLNGGKIRQLYPQKSFQTRASKKNSPFS